MKINNDFKDFYSSYKDKINCYYNKSKKKYFKNICKVIICEFFLILLLITFYFFYSIKFSNDFILIILIIEIISLLYSFLFIANDIAILKNKFYKEFNMNLYHDILLFISNNDFIYEENTELDINDFNKMSLFNLDILNYEGKNFTASVNKNKRFLLCDVTLYDLIERIKKDVYYNSYENIKYITNYHYHDKVNIFSGMYYETTINRKNNKYIYLIPDNINDKFIRHNLNHYLIYDGKLVKLENLEFEKKYAVYSLDEIKSRYILSLTLMEKINKLDKLIPNKKYLVFKEDGRVGIFIDSYSIEKILRRGFKISKVISKNFIERYFNEISKLFEICMTLEDIKSL